MSVGEDPNGRAFYTPSEVAKRWGVTAETVRTYIRSGALEAFRVGPRLLRISADRLAEFEARKAAEAARPKGRDTMTPEELEAERARDRQRTFIMRAIRDAGKRRKARDEARRPK